MPDLRHGPRAEDRDGGRGPEPRAPGDEPPILGQPGPDRAGVRPRDVRDDPRPAGPERSPGPDAGMGPVPAGGAGRAVGRLAVFCSRLDLDREP